MIDGKLFLKKIVKSIGICLLLAAGIKGYFFVLGHVKTENIDDQQHQSDEAKEAYFSEAFPSRGEIEGHLLDLTFLVSAPPIGNDVTYLDNVGNFSDWHGNEIKKGRWWIEPVIYRRVYKTKQRVDIVYTLCRQLSDNSITDDNCYLVGKNNIYWRAGQIDTEKGDVFELKRRELPPFSLPTTSISLEQIRAANK